MAICTPALILICELRTLAKLAPFSLMSLIIFIYTFLVGMCASEIWRRRQVVCVHTEC
jgi:hypothetical protein